MTPSRQSIAMGMSAAFVLGILPASAATAGQVEILPTLDAGASSPDGVNFVVTDGGTSINTQYLPQYDVDRRGILEFDLEAIPAGVGITSAALELDVTSLTHGGNTDYPVLRICGYAGDGSLSPSDATEIDVLIGESDPVTELAPISIGLDAAFIDSLLGASSHLGLVAWGSANGYQVGFSTSEGAAYGYDPPTLAISYALIQPGPGDTNFDGCVDGLDYNRWSLHYLDQPVPAWQDMGWWVGNFNDDDIVDGLDYNIWSVNYLSGCDGAPVPEPAAVGFLGAGVLLLLRRKRPQGCRTRAGRMRTR